MSDGFKPCPHCKGTGMVVCNTAFGSKMKAYRQSHKITLKQLSRELGVSISYVSDMEHGRKRFTDQMIKAYNRAIDEILKEVPV